MVGEVMTYGGLPFLGTICPVPDAGDIDMKGLMCGILFL